MARTLYSPKASTMFSLRHWLREVKEKGFGATKARQSRRFRPRVEDLEHRVAPAVRIWDGVQDLGGATANANWTTASNWVGDIAPQAGDDLVFAAGAAQLTNVNDFAAGTRFNTITISGSGYSHLRQRHRAVRRADGQQRDRHATRSA